MTHDPGQPGPDPLVAVLYAAHRAGSGVPDVESRWPQLADAVRRRWSSFALRHPAPAPATRPARIEDLARALLTRCAARPGVRPKMELSECRALARRLARVLEFS
jgi:hypothetical protein